MSGYGPTDGLMLVAMALATILLAIVSLGGTSTRKKNVIAGVARTADLAELTGIMDPKLLLQIFGPPDMGRVWGSVSLFETRRARRPIGWLLSSDAVDYAGMAIAVLAIVTPFLALKHVFEWLLIPALLAQVSGWIIATRLPK